MRLTTLDADGAVTQTRDVARVDLARVMREVEYAEAPKHPRWVWSDTALWYPPLLETGSPSTAASTCGSATPFCARAR